MNGTKPTTSETGYQADYIFVVPPDAVARFIDINTRAAAIYKKHEALASKVLTLADGETRHRCLGLTTLLNLKPGEEALCIQDEFRDRQHFIEVMKAADTEPEIEILFRELQALVDFGRAHRAEWSNASLSN